MKRDIIKIIVGFFLNDSKSLQTPQRKYYWDKFLGYCILVPIIFLAEIIIWQNTYEHSLYLALLVPGFAQSITVIHYTLYHWRLREWKEYET